MNKKRLQHIAHICFVALHVIMVLLMITLAGLSLFRADLVQLGIEWVGVQIKSW